MHTTIAAAGDSILTGGRKRPVANQRIPPGSEPHQSQNRGVNRCRASGALRIEAPEFVTSLCRVDATDDDFYTRKTNRLMPGPRNDHNRALNNQRMLLASQCGLDLFQAIDVFLQAGDMILHFYEG